MLEAFASLAALIAAFASAIATAVWILRPIDQAGRSRNAPARYSVADFLCLFVAIQIPLAIGYRVFHSTPQGGDALDGAFPAVTIFTSIFAVVLWYSCAKALSKAGIVSVAQRFVFMGIIAPLVYYGFFPMVVLTGMVVAQPLLPSDSEMQHLGRWSYAAFFFLAAAFFLSGVYVRWILARPEISDEVVLEGRQ